MDGESGRHPANAPHDNAPHDVDAASADDRQDPAAIRARAFRQRERLQALWQQSRASMLASDEKLRRARAELEAVRRSPAYRIESAIRRRIQALTSRVGRGRAPNAGSIVGPERQLDARAFRTGMLARLAHQGVGPAEPLRLAVIGATTATLDPVAVVRAFLGLGGIEARVADPAALAKADPPFDAALLLDPADVEGSGVPITIACLGDAPEPWLDRAWFDDIDLVLVSDDAARAVVEARSSKVATVVRSPDTAEGAAAVREALRNWVELRHVAIHIGARTREAAAGWGDLPFGRAVQRAFERRGWPASIHVHAERDSPRSVRADMAVHIFGVRAPVVREGQPTVLWIISHPDHVTRELVTGYDLVGVASTSYLESLRAWLGPDMPSALSLHQATDPERFFPEPGGPAHELLFVGSSRNQRRRILDDLAGTTHELAVYGRGWTPDLIDPELVRGEWIPNDELRRYYAAAGIVLSDAYPDMRDEGFIPNRVYDALASGALVVSEAIAGLDAEFDGSVAEYRDRADLQRLVDHYLADPDEHRTLAQAGRKAVLARHTFDHRVAAIIDAFEALERRSADPAR